VRSSKPRPSLGGAFRRTSDGQKSAVQKVEPAEPAESTPTRDSKKVPRSSLSLRETIAMAKKAARTSNVGIDGPALDEDPFNHIPKDGNKGLLRKRVEAARTSGHLNLAAMGLRDIPDEVMNMYEFDPAASGEWYESVDLIKFIAADNELESIRDDAFPVACSGENEDAKSSQFGGLEILDLHGNILGMLPAGLGLLLRLRVLNLSNNRLDAEAFSIICQVESLTELKIANNAIGGALLEKIGALKNLEVLDVHGNSFEGLPESLGDLTRLRILQISENKISSIPFDAISKLPLTDIIATKNNLGGTLIPESIQGFSRLRVLNVANNSLTALSSQCLDMPNLQQLSIDCNRITSIPDITSWENLLTITAEDCKFSDLPEGFVTLTNLRNADFTGNDLTKLDERIALMENLHNLQIASNPLRDRKFLTMATDELKRDLLSRLDPALRPHSDDPSLEDSADGSLLGSSASSNTEGWPVKHGGILDRSSTQMESLEESDLEATRSKGEIRSLLLHHNLLTMIPLSLSILAATLTNLDLSHNKLSSTLEATMISLHHLKSLNLSSNGLTSTSFLSNLSAPSLSHLDISCNRLTTLPRYRIQFPELLTVLACDNSISELDVEAVRGLRTLDVARNDIGFLPPKLGLLSELLRSLEVGGNTFRVPRYTVLEKGTEATLAWLRDKIPVGEVEVQEEGEGESGGSEVDSVD
jgi:Leucine-rich repeat (LRR) protein